MQPVLGSITLGIQAEQVSELFADRCPLRDYGLMGVTRPPERINPVEDGVFAQPNAIRRGARDTSGEGTGVASTA